MTPGKTQPIIQRVLQVYEESSGQQLNRSKTSICFSPNTDHDTKEAVKAMFGAHGGKQANGVEGKIAVKCWKGGTDQGGSTGSPFLHNELL